MQVGFPEQETSTLKEFTSRMVCSQSTFCLPLLLVPIQIVCSSQSNNDTHDSHHEGAQSTRGIDAGHARADGGAGGACSKIRGARARAASNRVQHQAPGFSG